MAVTNVIKMHRFLLFYIFMYMGDINYPHIFIQVQCCHLCRLIVWISFYWRWI